MAWNMLLVTNIRRIGVAMKLAQSVPVRNRRAILTLAESVGYKRHSRQL